MVMVWSPQMHVDRFDVMVLPAHTPSIFSDFCTFLLDMTSIPVGHERPLSIRLRGFIQTLDG